MMRFLKANSTSNLEKYYKGARIVFGENKVVDLSFKILEF